MRFPSQEWGAAFEAALNENEAYAMAAAQWEGDILLLVLGQTPMEPAPGVRLDLYHGKCRSATFFPDARTVATEFVYQGPRESWAKLFHGEIDPVKAILDGTFQIKGNLAKAMRFTRAAKELVETAARIPVEM